MKVMVIDDEYFTRKDICTLLKEFEDTLEISDFETPLPALDYLKSNRVDIIISDIRMPDMDGLDFFEIVEREYPGIYPMIVSGFGDFEYAQRAIKFGVKAYVLKPVDEQLFFDELAKAFSFVSSKAASENRERLLAERERSAEREIIEDRLYYFLFAGGDKPGRSEVEAEIMWAKATHCIGIVKTDVTLSTPMLQAIRDSLESCYGDTRYYLINGRNGRELVLLLYWVGALPMEEDLLYLRIRKLMKRLILEGQRSFNAKYYIAVSEIRTGLKGLEENLRRAEDLITMRFYVHSNSVLDAKCREAHVARSGSDTNQKMVLLEDLLMKGYWSTVAEELNEIFRQIGEGSLDCIYDILRICRLCYNVLVKRIWRNDYRLSEDAEKVRNRLANMSNYFDAGQLKGDILYLLDSVARADTMKISRDDLVSDLESYLNKNYDLDISLSELARKRYNVSVEHLNRKFKSRFGQNLSVYLKELRIGKACDLLKDGSLTITDIAGMVGYNDISHFIQTFKKLRGVTPGEFRRAESRTPGGV
ncbi:MAG: helix-turn-helix domain-containing protein [Spirochaetales bacterium]|nr:helix-turn-helix domain-containing protein [Spirochaetales bacterium]